MEIKLTISDDQIEKVAAAIARQLYELGPQYLKPKQTKEEVEILTSEMLEKYDENALYTRADIMERYSISNRTVTNYIQNGSLKPLKSGNKYYFTTEDVDYLGSILNVKRKFNK